MYCGSAGARGYSLMQISFVVIETGCSEGAEGFVIEHSVTDPIRFQFISHKLFHKDSF